VKKPVEAVVEPVEGGVCLYKSGESKVFTKAEAQEALGQGWQDTPQKRRGRPPNEERAE